jgi:hypothetical protein
MEAQEVILYLAILRLLVAALGTVETVRREPAEAVVVAEATQLVSRVVLERQGKETPVGQVLAIH